MQLGGISEEEIRQVHNLQAYDYSLDADTVCMVIGGFQDQAADIRLQKEKGNGLPVMSFCELWKSEIRNFKNSMMSNVWLASILLCNSSSCGTRQAPEEVQ